jgi:hypothetical protein
MVSPLLDWPLSAPCNSGSMAPPPRRLDRYVAFLHQHMVQAAPVTSLSPRQARAEAHRSRQWSGCVYPCQES